MTAPRLTIAEARAMTPPDLREAVAGEIRHALRLSGSCVREEICSDASCACCLEAADAALAIIRAALREPSAEMCDAAVHREPGFYTRSPTADFMASWRRAMAASPLADPGGAR